MNITITSAMASFCTTMPVGDAMATIKHAGFDGLDFPISVYSRPLDSPLRLNDWREWTRRVRAQADDLELPILQAHASWEQLMPEDLSYVPPYEIYTRTMEACHMLGCKRLIFHPVLYLYRIPNEQLKYEIMDWNVRWFRELLPLAEEFDIEIELENTFDYRRVQKAGDPPFTYTSALDMLILRNRIASERVQICLDTGHANIYAQDVPSMIRAYGPHLRALHLNDNYGLIQPVYEDLHLFPGYGRLPWQEIFAALREIGYQETLNIEPVGELKRMPDAIRRIQLAAARDIVWEMARSTML